jgi:hypothetical protein
MAEMPEMLIAQTSGPEDLREEQATWRSSVHTYRRRCQKAKAKDTASKINCLVFTVERATELKWFHFPSQAFSGEHKAIHEDARERGKSILLDEEHREHAKLRDAMEVMNW